jgi:hypothetical protein
MNDAAVQVVDHTDSVGWQGWADFFPMSLVKARAVGTSSATNDLDTS